MKKSIAILLATYNGANHIAEQIDSLLSQTLQGWELYVHDDGSKDDTVSIVKSYADKYEFIHMMDYPSQGGAKNNFFSILERVDADIYLFCDQDDVWLPTKVEKYVNRLEEEEKKHPNAPVIVYSDLFVTDIDLNIIHESFLEFSGIHPQFINTFAESAATGFVTGCAMCFNRKAKEIVQYPVDKAQMHDAWITLCVIRDKGIISFIPEPLILYRQHFDNTLGARDVKVLTIGYRIKNIRRIISGHLEHYAMLKALGYGSFAKYVWNKILYRKRINRYRRELKNK